MSDKFFGMIGLCAKAGKVVYGAYACETGIKKRKIKLLLLEGDISDNSKNDFQSICDNFGIPIIINEYQRSIGEAVGKPANKVFGIVCPGFSDRIKKIHEDMNSGGVELEQN